MSWVAVGVAGASLIGGMMSSNSASSAASAQNAASERALAEQRRQYDQTRQDNEAYRNAGTTALGQLTDPNLTRAFTMNDFQADPGYQYRQDEANKALQRSAAAKGGLLGGQTLKALTETNQNMASQEYQNAFNRFGQNQAKQVGMLSQLAGYGLSANGSNQAAGSNYANNASNIMTANGNAQGAAAIAQGNAWNNTMSGIAGGITAGSQNWGSTPQTATTGYGAYAGPDTFKNMA